MSGSPSAPCCSPFGCHKEVGTGGFSSPLARSRVGASCRASVVPRFPLAFCYLNHPLHVSSLSGGCAEQACETHGLPPSIQSMGGCPVEAGCSQSSAAHYGDSAASPSGVITLSFLSTDNPEVISRNGTECHEASLRMAKHGYCTYYPVSSSLELPQTAC